MNLQVFPYPMWFDHVSHQGKKYTQALDDFAPEMQKSALENQKRAPENRHRL